MRSVKSASKLPIVSSWFSSEDSLPELDSLSPSFSSPWASSFWMNAGLALISNVPPLALIACSIKTMACSKVDTPTSLSLLVQLRANNGWAISLILTSHSPSLFAFAASNNASLTASMPSYSEQATSHFACNRTALCINRRCNTASMSFFNLSCISVKSVPGWLKSSSFHTSNSPITCFLKASKALGWFLCSGQETFSQRSSTPIPFVEATCCMMPWMAFAFAKTSCFGWQSSDATRFLDKLM
mmetsp:Transcript_18821/g.37971  ORF Transcript_18821/g.37971 Transcript_18821/m.37971 type:complete len:243 (+) Transcript_18821:153-881(+)